MSDKSKQSKERPPRYKEFIFVLYPESMGTALDDIKKSVYKYCISPLHDKDVNEDTGEIKKPHYHCAILFDTLQSEKKCRQVASEFGIKHIEFCKAGRKQALRYFCHLDHSDKALYDTSDVQCGHGYDYGEVLDYTEKESPDTIIIKAIEKKTKNGELTTFRAFVMWMCDERPDLIPHIVKRAYFYNNVYFYARDQDEKKPHSA